jgi:SH3 domain-containing YSC84-like protein 1
MKRLISLFAGLLMLAPLALAKPRADKEETDKDRIHSAATVLKEILDAPDNIPQSLLDRARCVIVMPSIVKAAFIVGGSYGHGVMVCRTGREYMGPWGAPVMMALEGGSFGLQIGGQATDFVILVMDSRGADALLHSKVKLGADASVAAGPKGRTAEADTDVSFRTEMLSYSRARGVFAGVSLEGSTLRPDGSHNKALYGDAVSAEQIAHEPRHDSPEGTHALDAELQQVSPHLNDRGHNPPPAPSGQK